MSNWIDKFLQSRIKKNYLQAVCILGDMESYSYLGTPVGHKQARDNVAYWTKRLIKIGYRPFTPDERIKFGGYGYDIKLTSLRRVEGEER